MILEDVVNKFVEKPCRITTGAPSLAKRWGVDVDIVYQARAIAKDILKNKEEFGTEYDPKDVAFNHYNNILNGEDVRKPFKINVEKNNYEQQIYDFVRDIVDKEYFNDEEELNEPTIEKLNPLKVNLDFIKTNTPKILIFDLETSPLKAWVWGRWQQNVHGDQLISDWFLLTWSAKWLYSSEIMNGTLTPQEVLAEDDSRIIADSWKLVDEADILIAHNGDRFDVPRLNSRFAVNGLPPTSSYKTIDTKKVAAQQFGFSSNKLNELGKVFGLGEKLDTDFELWANCMLGDAASLAYMQKYNDQDVILLEEIYLKLRPFIKSHPNAAVYDDSNEAVCSMCGSKHLTEEGYYYTNTAKYKQYRCDCGALSRGRVNLLSKDKKAGMLTAIPR